MYIYLVDPRNWIEFFQFPKIAYWGTILIRKLITTSVFYSVFYRFSTPWVSGGNWKKLKIFWAGFYSHYLLNVYARIDVCVPCESTWSGFRWFVNLRGFKQ